MWKFIVPILLALGAQAQAFEDPGVDWYVLATMSVTPTQNGTLIFKHASSTKAECDAWLKSEEFYGQLAGIMSDLVKIHPQIKIASAKCVQPPENAGGNPA